MNAPLPQPEPETTEARLRAALGRTAAILSAYERMLATAGKFDGSFEAARADYRAACEMRADAEPTVLAPDQRVSEHHRRGLR